MEHKDGFCDKCDSELKDQQGHPVAPVVCLVCHKFLCLTCATECEYTSEVGMTGLFYVCKGHLE